ncbi:hypothetical protein PQI51_10070 [Microbacterium esteraromaticum]|uniref:hypothetical protein n=1 Tax=Microbacterium esteraromaticum TaxID=57043 RepID=UPI00309D48DB
MAFALTAYVAFHGAVRLTPMSLSLDLAVFLVVGAFAAMLTSSDPQWWQNNLSALGQTTNSAAPAFNVTLILSGMIVTTIARYATSGLPSATPGERRCGLRVRRGGRAARRVLRDRVLQPHSGRADRARLTARERGAARFAC